MTAQSVSSDVSDTDSQLFQAAVSSDLTALQDWISKLKGSPDATSLFTRTFLSAITEASEGALRTLLGSGLVNVHAEDEINERNCLHEAAISGRDAVLGMGLENAVSAARVDAYGRTPLHYACVHGHEGIVSTLLLCHPTTIDYLDHDNFTPLIHAIVNHRLACGSQLLDYGARIDPENDSDHVPLNLACQYGSAAIARLLLDKGARILPDAEGLFPQHLVARSGQSPDMLLLLEGYGANMDQRDRLYQWTPLFHAASEGHVDCISILLGKGVNVGLLDEKQFSALYYATWEGHLECMRLLNKPGAGLMESSETIAHHAVSSVSQISIPVQTDADGIPDLSLPPPIIPFRRYGHSFLDEKTYIQLNFEGNSTDAILFYHDGRYPAARLTVSSKSSDVIPRNILLPIQEDSKIITFHIDSLDSFAIEFEIFPTFGSKIIAKSVALPSLFTGLRDSGGQCCLPLFDIRLRAIGHISFKVQIIKPFHGIPLDIIHYATYWRATSQVDTHPANFITGSSLSGDYIQLFTQLTNDSVPVLYPKWSVDHHGIEIPISRMSHQQFLDLASTQNGSENVLASLPQMAANDLTAIPQVLASSFVTLRDVLAYLPTNVHVNIQVLFPMATQERPLGFQSIPDINHYVDTILNDIFNHARHTKEQDPDSMRSVVFTSYNPDICTALNWKQPNCKAYLLRKHRC